MYNGSVKIILLLMFCHMVGQPVDSCHSFEYVLKTGGGEECCPKCIPGHRVKKDCTEFQSTSCTSCDGGTYMDKFNGEKQCHQCLTCTEGTGLREIRSCTTKENTVCEPEEGFFCVDGSVNRCVAAQRHSRCASGQYISRAGTSSTDTECVSCSEGTFSDGTFTSCQPHQQCTRVQTPGTIYSDSVCLEGLTQGEVAGIVTGILLLTVGAAACAGVCLKRKRLPGSRPARRNEPPTPCEDNLLVGTHTFHPGTEVVPEELIPRSDGERQFLQDQLSWGN